MVEIWDMVNENNERVIFGTATFVGGVYYLQTAVRHAVEFNGLPPEYLNAVLYTATSILMFYLFSTRSRYNSSSPAFWIFTVWGLFVFVHFVTRILPTYSL